MVSLMKQTSRSTASLSVICIALFASAQSFDSFGEASNSNVFIPERVDYYNPLKHDNDGHKPYAILRSALTNADLKQAAEDIRNNEMSTEQRALNHQWLDHDNYTDDQRFGSKVISQILKMGFKTYWKDVRKNNYSNAAAVPTEEGKGKITPDVDYKFRISGNKLKLSVEYEF